MVHLALGQRVEVEQVDDLRHRLRQRPAPQAVQAAEVGQVVRHRQRPVQPSALGCIPDHGADRFRARYQPVDGDLPAVGFQQADDAAHRGGLARAVGAQQTERLPGRHRERQVVDGDERAIPLGQRLNLQQRHG